MRPLIHGMPDDLVEADGFGFRLSVGNATQSTDGAPSDWPNDAPVQPRTEAQLSPDEVKSLEVPLSAGSISRAFYYTSRDRGRERSVFVVVTPSVENVSESKRSSREPGHDKANFRRGNYNVEIDAEGLSSEELDSIVGSLTFDTAS